MLQDFQDALNVYLFPFVIAVPIAIVLYLLVTRRDEPPGDAGMEPGAGAAGSTWPTGVNRHAVPPELQRPGSTANALGAAQGTNLPDASAPLLLVDDSAVARAMLRRLFEGAGYPVDVAKDGVEALEMLSRKRYALMVTDLEMPHMDGIELIAAVHGSLATEDLPIIAITGHDDLQAKVHECEGLFGIFKKPWNDRDLLRRVQALVRVQSNTAAGAAV